MDGWGSEADPEKLFSDQIEDEEAFFYEEPTLGIEDMVLDEPQSGITHVPKDIKKLTAIDSQLKDEGHPGIFNIESSQLENLANEKRENDMDNALNKLFGYIAEYGLVHGMGMYYANNLETVEENYGQEESI